MGAVYSFTTSSCSLDTNSVNSVGTADIGAIQYPNLTIIDEDDLARLSSKIFQTYIVARFPQENTAPITIHDIKASAELQYNAQISIYEVSKLGADFLFHTRPSNISEKMLGAGYLDIYENRATLIPWHPEYGCTKIPAYTQIINPRDIDYNRISRNMPQPLKELQIDIAGIPAHLCHDSTVKTILKPRCIVDHITFNPIDNKYHIDARAHSPNAIPSVAHLAVNKFYNGQSLLHMWPLFLETEDVTSENYLNMQFQLEEQNRDIGTCTLNIFSYLCKKPTHPISKLLIIGDGTVQANQNDHGGFIRLIRYIHKDHGQLSCIYHTL
jgi:hypothetical protein